MRQTAETKAKGKWKHDNNLESFLKTLTAPKQAEKSVDTTKPLIVVDAALLRYFHY